MKNNKLIRCILKSLPLFVGAIFAILIHRYISSLTGLFIGEILGTFNNDASILPEFLQKFINYTDLKSQITSISLVYLIVVLIGVVADSLARTLRVLHFQKLYISLSETFYNHVITIPKSEFANRSTGDIIQRNISDCKRIPHLFRMTLYELSRSIFTIVMLSIQLYKLNKIIFVISLVAILICIAISGYYGYFKVKSKEVQSSQYYSELNATIQQSITNYSLVKSFNRDEYEYDKFKIINDKKENNNYYINNIHCRYWLITDTLTSLYIMTCMGVMGYLFFKGSISLAAVSATTVIVAGFLNSGTQLINHITQFVKASISANRLNEYFKIESEYTNDGEIDTPIEGRIEFKNVFMKYDAEYILKDISFAIDKGQTLGIVGKSGSGKSSLVNLLTRLDDYDKGSILIDGVELKEYKKKHIRNNMGFVLQDSYIFSKTIKENLLILIDNDRIDLDQYLKRVGLDEDINKFESGLETVVGERGVTLSGGQRQRMSLLRTMIKNKKILILDDTLSAVDNLVSTKIKESISKEKVTTIIISHNLLNIKDADKIIVLDEGRIVDCGSHDELIKRDGYYANVWNLQQKIEEVE